MSISTNILKSLCWFSLTVRVLLILGTKGKNIGFSYNLWPQLGWTMAYIVIQHGLLGYTREYQPIKVTLKIAVITNGFEFHSISFQSWITSDGCICTLAASLVGVMLVFRWAADKSETANAKQWHFLHSLSSHWSWFPIVQPVSLAQERAKCWFLQRKAIKSCFQCRLNTIITTQTTGCLGGQAGWKHFQKQLKSPSLVWTI